MSHIMQDLFEHLDIIVFVEATIYQMDEDNEKLCAAGLQNDQHVLAGSFDAAAKPYHPFLPPHLLQTGCCAGEAAILSVLKQKGLLDQKVIDELAQVCSIRNGAHASSKSRSWLVQHGSV